MDATEWFAIDIVERLRTIDVEEEAYITRALVQEASDVIERLRTALGRLVNDSMYKDHPEASQMAIDALQGKR